MPHPAAHDAQHVRPVVRERRHERDVDADAGAAHARGLHPRLLQEEGARPAPFTEHLNERTMND